MPHSTPEKRAAYLAATRERRVQRQKEYNDTHSTDREAWRRANIEKVREMERARYASDLEASRAKDRADYQKHKEKRQAKSRAYGRSPATQQPLYSIWTGIKTRCFNPKAKDYPRYGGRGIGMCDRWRDSYTAFEADMLPGYVPGLTIERIQNDSDYAPENCRWATPKEQSRNQRINIYVDTPWGRMLLVEAAERAGLSYFLVWRRHKKGADLFAPITPRRDRWRGIW